MAQLTVAQYDALERAIVQQQRVMIMRRGTEYAVIPERIRIVNGREAIVARHPNTGDALTLYLDEADALEVLG